MLNCHSEIKKLVEDYIEASPGIRPAFFVFDQKYSHSNSEKPCLASNRSPLWIVNAR